MTGPSPRLQALDGLRGLAIGAVLMHHAVSWTGGPEWVGGHHGVTLFFVLSGFLITYLLLTEFGSSGAVSLRWFYARRAARILPALGLALAASLLFSYWDGMSSAQLGIGALLVLFFAINWAFRPDTRPFPRATHGPWPLKSSSTSAGPQYFAGGSAVPVACSSSPSYVSWSLSLRKRFEC